MTREIAPRGLIRIYCVLGISLPGNAAVKISTGEPGGRNLLQPEFIRNLVQELMGIIVECDTACEGRKNTSKAHWKTMRDHRFTAITPCGVLGEEGHMPLPVTDGHCLAGNYVGSHLQNYDSILMLFHFKGHATGDFGGALKNMSIGLTPSYGEIWTHSSGTSARFEDVFTADRDSFLESMANADRSAVDYMGREDIAYINVANCLSVDCDCNAHPHDPEMGDIDVFASIDPVALDQTCVDAIYASEDGGKTALIERMESRNGIHAVETAHSLDLDNRRCELRRIDSYKN